MSKQPHPAEAQIQKALEIQAELLKHLQAIHKAEKGRKDPRYPWCGLAAIQETNRRLAEAVGFNSPCGEGSIILAELSK